MAVAEWRVWWQDSEWLAVFWQSSDVLSACGGSSGHPSGKWPSSVQSVPWLLPQTCIPALLLIVSVSLRHSHFPVQVNQNQSLLISIVLDQLIMNRIFTFKILVSCARWEFSLLLGLLFFPLRFLLILIFVILEFIF